MIKGGKERSRKVNWTFLSCNAKGQEVYGRTLVHPYTSYTLCTNHFFNLTCWEYVPLEILLDDFSHHPGLLHLLTTRCTTRYRVDTKFIYQFHLQMHCIILAHIMFKNYANTVHQCADSPQPWKLQSSSILEATYSPFLN